MVTRTGLVHTHDSHLDLAIKRPQKVKRALPTSVRRKVVNKYGEKMWDGDVGSDHLYQPGAGVLKPRDSNSGQYAAGSQKNFLKMKSGKPMSQRASRLAQVQNEKARKGQFRTEKTQQKEEKQPRRGRRGGNKQQTRNPYPRATNEPIVAVHNSSEGCTAELDSMYKQTLSNQKKRDQENVGNSEDSLDEYERLKKVSAQNKLLIKFYKNKGKGRRQGRNSTAPGGSHQYEQPDVSNHDMRGGLASAGNALDCANGNSNGNGNYNMPSLQNNGFGQVPHMQPGRISSHSFATGSHQNTGNVITERSSVRLHAPAGGHTSINLFDGSGGNGNGANSPIGTNNDRGNRGYNYDSSGSNDFVHGSRPSVSSNSYANGMHQNTGNILTDKSSTKRLAPPGGYSQMNDFF